jgi:hypothetical protein
MIPGHVRQEQERARIRPSPVANRTCLFAALLATALPAEQPARKSEGVSRAGQLDAVATIHGLAQPGPSSSRAVPRWRPGGCPIGREGEPASKVGGLPGPSIPAALFTPPPATVLGETLTNLSSRIIGRQANRELAEERRGCRGSRLTCFRRARTRWIDRGRKAGVNTGESTPLSFVPSSLRSRLVQTHGPGRAEAAGAGGLHRPGGGARIEDIRRLSGKDRLKEAVRATPVWGKRGVFGGDLHETSLFRAGDCLGRAADRCRPEQGCGCEKAGSTGARQRRALRPGIPGARHRGNAARGGPALLLPPRSRFSRPPRQGTPGQTAPFSAPAGPSLPAFLVPTAAAAGALPAASAESRSRCAWLPS